MFAVAIPKIKRDQLIVVASFFSLCAMLMYALIIMEQPDEYVHVFRLIESERYDSGLYSIVLGWIIDHVGVNYYEIINTVNINRNFTFGSNQLVCNGCEGSFDYYILRYINQACVVGIIFLASWSLNNKKIYFISLMWPSVFYVVTGIGSDSFSVPLIIAATCLLIEGKVLFSIVLGIIAAAIDRSGYILLIFQCLFILINNLQIKVGIIMTFIPLAVFLIPVDVIVGLTNFDNELYDLVAATSVYNYSFEINVMNRILSMAASFWYLAGNLSITAFYIEYAVFFIICISILYYSNFNERQLLFSATFAIAITLLVVPTLAQARYYFFLVPVLVYSIIRQGKFLDSNGLSLVLPVLNFLYAFKFLIIFYLDK